MAEIRVRRKAAVPEATMEAIAGPFGNFARFDPSVEGSTLEDAARTPQPSRGPAAPSQSRADGWRTAIDKCLSSTVRTDVRNPSHHRVLH